MRRLLCVVAMCAVGLTACGTEGPAAEEANDPLVSVEQGLACETETGYCPGSTVCVWSWYPYEGVCRPPCINGACASPGDLCCNQPDGERYCDTSCR